MAKLPVSKPEQGATAQPQPSEPGPEKTFTRDEVEEIIAGVLARKQQPEFNAEALAKAMVQGTKQVNEEAAIINPAAKSRADRMKDIEKEIAGLDNEQVRPYLTYSTELYSHAAPTIGGHDFPKYILKRSGKKFGTDIAAKKVTWLTEREVARIKMLAEIKFIQIKAADENGNPILDKRTNQQKLAAVPFAAFIRLVPTVAAGGAAIDDPAELVGAMHARVITLEQELAAFKAGKAAGVAVPEAATKADEGLDAINAGLRRQKTDAMASEAEAGMRYGKDLPKGGPLA